VGPESKIVPRARCIDRLIPVTQKHGIEGLVMGVTASG
jgi:hypothetical protein